MIHCVETFVEDLESLMRFHFLNKTSHRVWNGQCFYSTVNSQKIKESTFCVSVCVMYAAKYVLALVPSLVCQCHLASLPAHCGCQLDANLSVFMKHSVSIWNRAGAVTHAPPHTSLFLYEWCHTDGSYWCKSIPCASCAHLLSLNRQAACVIFSYYYFKRHLSRLLQCLDQFAAFTLT